MKREAHTRCYEFSQIILLSPKFLFSEVYSTLHLIAIHSPDQSLVL